MTLQSYSLNIRSRNNTPKKKLERLRKQPTQSSRSKISLMRLNSKKLKTRTIKKRSNSQQLKEQK